MGHLDENKDKINLIEEKLHYQFQDRALLQEAFTHRSYYLDKKEERKEDNERLEFLGDTVLNLIVSTFLFSDPAKRSEGELTQLKEQIVDTPSLKEYTLKLGVQEFCLVGKGELERLNESSILADLFEAILGAIYMDGGFLAAKKFFLDHFQKVVEEKMAFPRRNWKKELQEYAQREYHELPLYNTVEESGPAHRKEFVVTVGVHGEIVGKGKGLSKKEAEMHAAQNAIEKQERK